MLLVGVGSCRIIPDLYSSFRRTARSIGSTFHVVVSASRIGFAICFAFEMSHKRASEKSSLHSTQHVAQLARRPSAPSRMEERLDFDAAVSRAVAAALQAQGFGASPAAASSAAAATTSPPKMAVTSRDIPEGLAIAFLANHGVRIVCGS